MTENNEKEILKLLTRSISGIEDLRDKFGDMQTQMGGMQNSINTMQTTIESIQEDVADIKIEIKVINKKITIIDNENRGLRSRIELVEDKLKIAN